MQVPWFAVVILAVSAIGIGLGMWLLFTDSNTGYIAGLDGFGASLPLVISILWLLAHAAAAFPALCFAAGLRRGHLALVGDCAEVCTLRCPVNSSKGSLADFLIP